MLIKRKSFTFQKHGSCNFSRIANSDLNKDKSAVPPLFNYSRLLPSACDKGKLFSEDFSKNSNLDDSGISWSAFSSRNNLKLQNILVSSKLVEKVITNLDSSKGRLVVIVVQW